MIKKMVVASFLLLSFSQPIFAQSWLKKEDSSKKSKGWIEDFTEAKKEAKQKKQPIFVLFTGSDWCPWCVRLEDEVLKTKDFKNFASANMVLFKADYLRGKPMPAKLKTQNDALKNRLSVQGFPTVILMDAEEKVLGQTGYRRGGGKGYVEHLREIFERAGIKNG